MFTVCPKCALTLVVTAQDLRVAQGYVRCGRCSNVFNAIVGLTDDRGALASGAGAVPQSTATTSIIRKAPSIADEPPHDPLSTTGESEAIYAEPDAEDVKFHEVFSEPSSTSRTTPRAAPPTDSSRPLGPIAFVAPPPGPAAKAYPPPPASALSPPPATTRSGDSEKRYSDTEGIETYPEHELEFNPDLTDVTKVFVEAAPVAFKNNATTGTFERLVLRSDDNSFESEPATPAASSPAASAPAPAASGSGAAPAAKSSAAASGRRKPPAKPAPAEAAPAAPPAATRRVTPPPPSRDSEDLEIDSELRSLAARLDATSSQPAPRIPPAANEEGIGADDEDPDRSIGDIYAKAIPRPPPPRDVPRPNAAMVRADAQAAAAASNDDAEIQAVGAADSLAPAPRRRGRTMWWVAGSAVLSLVLVAQAVHHNRHELATNAMLNRPLTSFYKSIGVALVPSWDLTAYDVRQLGASTNDGGQGTLTVRASLKNTATQPLPLPLLRITMQDRYGNRIATRDVEPKGYVPGAVPAEAHLGAGQRIDAEMTFKDPGQNAVGFEIDACLLSASGRISCANDAAAPPR